MVRLWLGPVGRTQGHGWTNRDEQRNIKSVWHTHVDPINSKSNPTSFSLLSDVTLATWPAWWFEHGLLRRKNLNCCLNETFHWRLLVPNPLQGVSYSGACRQLNDTHVLAHSVWAGALETEENGGYGLSFLSLWNCCLFYWFQWKGILTVHSLPHRSTVTASYIV